MVQDVTLRPMRSAERERVIDLKWEMNRATPEIIGSSLVAFEEDFDYSREAAAGATQKYFDQHESGEGVILVAVKDNVVVGYLAWTTETSSTSIHERFRTTGHVGGLIVTEKARNQGIGSMLLEAAEQITRQRSLLRMSLSTLVLNDAAVRVYERNGFQPMSYHMFKVIAPDEEQ
jgi:ribosomal protein S18 acetylase RimI-like enzyme